MNKTVAFVVVVAGLLLGGCDKNCQNSCAKVYDESQCNVIVPGQDPDKLRRECIAECQSALTNPGNMDGYNPYERIPPGSDYENFELQNEVQAAVWMECVASQECDALQLEGGVCWPIP